MAVVSSSVLSPRNFFNNDQQRQDLRILARNQGPFVASGIGKISNASLADSIREPLKGITGFGDRTSPEAVEFELIRFLGRAAIQNIFTEGDLYYINSAARNVGLIRGNNESERDHVELAALIHLISKQVNSGNTINKLDVINLAANFYKRNEPNLSRISPLSSQTLEKLSKVNQATGNTPKADFNFVAKPEAESNTTFIALNTLAGLSALAGLAYMNWDSIQPMLQNLVGQEESSQKPTIPTFNVSTSTDGSSTQYKTVEQTPKIFTPTPTVVTTPPSVNTTNTNVDPTIITTTTSSEEIVATVQNQGFSRFQLIGGTLSAIALFTLAYAGNAIRKRRAVNAPSNPLLTQAKTTPLNENVTSKSNTNNNSSPTTLDSNQSKSKTPPPSSPNFSKKTPDKPFSYTPTPTPMTESNQPLPQQQPTSNENTNDKELKKNEQSIPVILNLETSSIETIQDPNTNTHAIEETKDKPQSNFLIQGFSNTVNFVTSAPRNIKEQSGKLLTSLSSLVSSSKTTEKLKTLESGELQQDPSKNLNNNNIDSTSSKQDSNEEETQNSNLIQQQNGDEQNFVENENQNEEDLLNQLPQLTQIQNPNLNTQPNSWDLTLPNSQNSLTQSQQHNVQVIHPNPLLTSSISTPTILTTSPTLQGHDLISKYNDSKNLLAGAGGKNWKDADSKTWKNIGVETLKSTSTKIGIAHNSKETTKHDALLDTSIKVQYNKDTVSATLDIPVYGIFKGIKGDTLSKYFKDYILNELIKKLPAAFEAEDKENAIKKALETVMSDIHAQYRLNKETPDECDASLALIIGNKLWVVNYGTKTRALIVSDIVKTPQPKGTLAVLSPSSVQLSSSGEVQVVNYDISKASKGSPFYLAIYSGIGSVSSLEEVANQITKYVNEKESPESISIRLAKKGTNAMKTKEEISILVAKLEDNYKDTFYTYTKL